MKTLQKYHRLFSIGGFVLLLVAWILISPVIFLKGGVPPFWYTLTPTIILVSSYVYSYSYLDLSFIQRGVFSIATSTIALLISTLFVMRPFIDLIYEGKSWLFAETTHRLIGNGVYYGSAALMIGIFYPLLYKLSAKRRSA